MYTLFFFKKTTKNMYGHNNYATNIINIINKIWLKGLRTRKCCLCRT